MAYPTKKQFNSFDNRYQASRNITSIDTSVAGEGSLWGVGVDGVVLAGGAGNGILQHGDGVA